MCGGGRQPCSLTRPLLQSDFFRDFVDRSGALSVESRRDDAVAKHLHSPRAATRSVALPEGTPKRKQKKGKEDDGSCEPRWLPALCVPPAHRSSVLAAEDGLQVVRLQHQPSLIKNGTLRHYQLEGLNWMATLFVNGVNAILADEMVGAVAALGCAHC